MQELFSQQHSEIFSGIVCSFGVLFAFVCSVDVACVCCLNFAYLRLFCFVVPLCFLVCITCGLLMLFLFLTISSCNLRCFVICGSISTMFQKLPCSRTGDIAKFPRALVILCPNERRAQVRLCDSLMVTITKRSHFHHCRCYCSW